MKVFDLSHALEPSMQIYPGDPTFSCHRAATVEDDGYNVSSLSLGSHTGTHIDAPYHFIKDGQKTDELDLSLLVGHVAVLHTGTVDLKARQRIRWDYLLHHNAEALSSLETSKCKIVFVRTNWSRYWKTPSYVEHPFLDRGVATELLKRGVRVLGVDTLNPDETPRSDSEGEGAEGDFGVHETLLGAGAMIVENLTRLEELPDCSSGKEIHVSLLPLKIEGCDGSPIRAAAWVGSSDT